MLILNEFRRMRDPRILTRWYFEWDPHPKQLEWLNAVDRGYSEMFMSTGNRIGKSEVAGMALLLTAMLNPSDEFPVLNTSITMDQAKIVWNFCERKCYSENFEHWIDDIVMSPFPTIKLRTGTEIWARSTQYDCKHIEGHKFRYVNFDEIALGTAESLAVLKMRVADCDGSIAGTGTPRGQNWYYRDCWRRANRHIEECVRTGERPYAYTIKGSSYDNPHISHAYLDRLKATLTQRQIAQKIYGDFTDDADKPLSAEAIEAATNPDLEVQYKLLCEYVAGGPMPESRLAKARALAETGYWVLGWDLAKHQDWTVCTAMRIDTDPWTILYFDRYQKRPWPEVERHIKAVGERFPHSETIIDASGVGDVTCPPTRPLPSRVPRAHRRRGRAVSASSRRSGSGSSELSRAARRRSWCPE